MRRTALALSAALLTVLTLAACNDNTKQECDGSNPSNWSAGLHGQRGGCGK